MARLTIDVRELQDLGKHLEEVAKEHPKIMARALNHTGGVVTTAVRRQVASQMGVKQAVVRNGMRTKRASPDDQSFAIIGHGRPMSEKLFGPRQTKAGVTTMSWGKRTLLRGTFIGPGKLGGHVFSRTGEKVVPEKGRWKGTGVKREKIEKKWGPAIPKEMVRGETKAVFESTVAERLPERILHELGRALVPVKKRR